MNTWRVDVTFGKEEYVNQGHLDPLEDLMRGHLDMPGTVALHPAEVEIQLLVSGPFSNTRVVSTVRLNCAQTEEKVNLTQMKATELAMEGLRNGWEALQERVEKGHFPGGGK